MSRKPNRPANDLARSKKALSAAMADLKRATEMRNQLEKKLESHDTANEIADDVAAKQKLLALKYERILLMHEVKMLKAKIGNS